MTGRTVINEGSVKKCLNDPPTTPRPPPPKAQRASRDVEVVYLKKVDAGTPNECWVVCNKVDSGAVPFIWEC